MRAGGAALSAGLGLVGARCPGNADPNGPPRGDLGPDRPGPMSRAVILYRARPAAPRMAARKCGKAMKPVNHDGEQRVIARDDLGQMLGAITQRGFRCR